MTKPDLNGIKKTIPYFDYWIQHVLPSVYDDSLSHMELLNKVVLHLNEIGTLSNDTVAKWNEVSEWIMNEGLTENVNAKVDSLVSDGTMDTIVNENLFIKLNSDLNNRVLRGENESISLAMLSEDIKTVLNSGVWEVNLNSSDIERDAILPEKTDFASELKTLTTIGVNTNSVVTEAGTLGGSSGIYETCDFQTVKAGKHFYVSEMRSIGFYKDDNSVVDVIYPSGVQQEYTGMIPTGATKWRIAYPTGKPPKVRLYNSKDRSIVIDELTVKGEQINFKNGTLTANLTDFAIEIGNVPAYPANAGKVISVSGQLDGSGGLYDTTNFLELMAGEWYIDNYRSIGFYRSDNSTHSVLYPNALLNGATFTIPDGVKTRISYVAGSNPKFYPLISSEKEVYIPNLVTNSLSDEVLIFLPKEIAVAVGRTIELYNRQVVWSGNLDNYHFKWECSIGRNLKRKFSVKGETVGSHALTLTVFDNNMNQVAQATSTIKVVSNIVSPRSILQIGDSLTNTTSSPKPVFSELRTLSNHALSFVGTRGTVAGEKHEGRSGFTAGQYLEAKSYTFEGEGVQPFWNGSRFSWGHYKSTKGINPNEITLFLGTNGMTLDPTINANNIKQIVDYIRQDDSSIPINVVYTLFRGDQDGLGYQTGSDGYSANKGAWKLEEDRKVFNLIIRLNELLKDYSKLYFIPIAQCHDSEYNFGSVERSVNPRAIQKELTPSEATHPQEQGYLQMSDIMFSVYCSH